MESVMMHSRSVALGVGVVVALSLARPARAEDCLAAAKADAERQRGKFARAVYWDGSPHCFVGCTDPLNAGGREIFYLAVGQEHVADSQPGVAVGLVRDKDGPEDAKPVPSPKNCAKLFFRRFAPPGAPPAPPTPPGAPGAPSPAPTPQACVDPAKATSLEPGDVIKRYFHPSDEKGFRGTSTAESIATEAVQVLGQIVADRASQAAYVLIQNRLLTQLKCTDKATRFPSTCRVLASLRLQDIAMSPAELRVALVQDALAWFGRSTGPGTPGVADASLAPHASATEAIARIPAAAPPVLAPAGDAVAAPRPVRALPAAVSTAPRGDAPPLFPDPYDFLRDGLERRLIPLLTHTAERITGHAAETEIRGIVDTTLRNLTTQGANAYCGLKEKDHVLAAAALGFAWCARQSNPGECAVMQVVPMFDEKCKPDQQLKPGQLSYAASIAGHLLDAYTLKKDSTTPDPQGRLVAAADATFEVACMYADDTSDSKQAGYQCKVDETKHGDTKLAAAEVVALARDLVLAALDRDGTSLITVVIRGARRTLPDPSKQDEVKAVRTLASIAAYAATYVSGSSPDDAHKQRTALLESLTRDMTVRTDRGGDLIFGLGGALRFVGGGRIGRSVNGTHPTAFASPLSLTLGLGLDYLFEDNHNGIHIEAGVLDLGQYLAWDEGVKLSTPDLGAVVSPSVTVGYFWHRELPVFLGATVGYTPSYDFTSDGSKPTGALNAGLTFGVYVPLFDIH